MADYYEIVTRKAVDSTLLRVYPGAIVEFYEAGTATLVTSATADSNGVASVASLATGIYDLKVDGSLIKTIHFVKADHTHKPDQTWTFFLGGGWSTDRDGDYTSLPLFVAPESGTIHSVHVVVHDVDATGDGTIHLLKGSAAGGSNLTIASNSVWNHRVNPGSLTYRYKYIDTAPAITMAADDVLQLGLDFTASTLNGVTVTAIFRPDA